MKANGTEKEKKGQSRVNGKILNGTNRAPTAVIAQTVNFPQSTNVGDAQEKASKKFKGKRVEDLC